MATTTTLLMSLFVHFTILSLKLLSKKYLEYMD